MRIAIVGAGNNADYHVRFSKAYKGARLVGIADMDVARAESYARTYGIERAYGSVSDLLSGARPDVVHVVTPPQTHFAIVREALEAGCHVVVEKPLALNAAEARALYDIAEQRGVMLCPVHNHLFDPCMRRADDLVKGGHLGTVINVESYYGLNTHIPPFRDYPQPNVLPWLYRLPGGVYQDFLPHAIYPVLEYTGRPRSITVKHRSTGVLPQQLPDEIRILVDGEHAFGTVTVSFAAKPHLHFVRVYGTNGMVEVDINTMTTTVHAVSSLPKAAQKATYNLDESWQKTRSTISNVFRFVRGKLKPYHGMMTLIHAYYDAIASGRPAPVSKDRALAVVETMDEIFAQLRYEPLNHAAISGSAVARRPGKVLVTGGTGFLGKKVIERLVADGYAVRVLARKLARVDPLVAHGAEVFWGDVADVDSFDAAFAGCDVVVHLAAGTSGSEKDSDTATLQGTRNLLELCARHRPRKLVYISSCSVYGVAEARSGANITETSPLERHPERRGSYSASKQRAEQYVSEYMQTGDVPVTILRPGTIYGQGGDVYTPLMGFSAGSLYVVIGPGGFVLPFVHVESVADAIAQSIEKPEANNEVFNVVDLEALTKREYMNRVIRKIDPRARVVYLPFPVLYGITWFQERVFALLKWRPVLTRYRLSSSQAHVRYDSSKIIRRLGWRPRAPLAQRLDQLVASQRTKTGEAPASAAPENTARLEQAPQPGA
jgi:predicted dehydrogenase/nucleoside-diphosphate-sugar epimerase